MDITSLDLNLLRVFDAIMATGNLTAGGEKLGLSQPAMSNALGRLRSHFDDPLFVRTGHGMKPTELGAALAGPIHDALEALDRSLRMQARFDATSSDREFHICTTDIGGLVLVPHLLARLDVVAPATRLKVGQYPVREIREMFVSGELDLAVGHLPELSGAIYQQRLFEDQYVLIARAGHPRIRSDPDLHRLAAESHVLVQSPGTGHSQLRELLTAANCRLQLEVREFASAPVIVAHTDLVATVPSRLAYVCARQLELGVFTHPLDIEPFAIKQFWHERNHRDPANIWLRNLITDLFGPSGQIGSMQAPRSSDPRPVP